VHVVGQQVLAARALTDAVDYRYAGRDGHEVTIEPITLPDEVAARCVQLSKQLGLPFCGIDLMARPDGSWVCFEVNPSPGYSWYQEAAGLPIADALVAWLAHRD
jgi:glutathione synthase/RimK-type ligase-like ATP-grasp enzyme